MDKATLVVLILIAISRSSSQAKNDRTLVVTTIINPPFTQYVVGYDPRSNSSSITGNARFEGYIVDLLQEISNILSN